MLTANISWIVDQWCLVIDIYEIDAYFKAQLNIRCMLKLDKWIYNTIFVCLYAILRRLKQCALDDHCSTTKFNALIFISYRFRTSDFSYLIRDRLLDRRIGRLPSRCCRCNRWYPASSRSEALKRRHSTRWRNRGYTAAEGVRGATSRGKLGFRSVSVTLKKSERGDIGNECLE